MVITVLQLDLPKAKGKRRSIKTLFEAELKHLLARRVGYEKVRSRNAACREISEAIYEATQFQDPHEQ